MIRAFYLAAEILPYLEDIPDIDEGKRFISTYIALTNRRLEKDGDDPIERNQTLKFIIMVDPRFGNMIK